MDFTCELGKIHNVLPFVILQQDKDEVIMLLNYMAEKSETAQGAKGTRHHVAIKSDRDESAAFWAAL